MLKADLLKVLWDIADLVDYPTSKRDKDDFGDLVRVFEEYRDRRERSWANREKKRIDDAKLFYEGWNRIGNILLHRGEVLREIDEELEKVREAVGRALSESSPMRAGIVLNEAKASIELARKKVAVNNVETSDSTPPYRSEYTERGY